MKQIFERYEKWEDYQNGMYELPADIDVTYLEELAAELLADSVRFRKACRDVLQAWPIASSVNLTNVSCNRRAWLGQAACNYQHGVPEIITRAAWNSLTNNQRLEANAIAGEVIYGYERACCEVYREMDGPGLFGRDTG